MKIGIKLCPFQNTSGNWNDLVFHVISVSAFYGLILRNNYFNNITSASHYLTKVAPQHCQKPCSFEGLLYLEVAKLSIDEEWPLVLLLLPNGLKARIYFQITEWNTYLEQMFYSNVHLVSVSENLHFRQVCLYFYLARLQQHYVCSN